jgi:hypothetical protein
MTVAPSNGASGATTGDEGHSEETIAQRNNRNLSDLMQELRVAGLGVQVLFGFLLAIPFTVRYSQLSPGQRDLYKCALLCAALSTALLISPVAYHRWHFRRHDKGRLLRIANPVALLGLASVSLAITLTVWLILSFVGTSWPFALVAASISATFFVLWFVLPILDRQTGDSR